MRDNAVDRAVLAAISDIELPSFALSGGLGGNCEGEEGSASER
jgi:hypothetical protein